MGFHTMSSRMTPEERALVDQAIANGKVQRIEPRIPMEPNPDPIPPMLRRESSGKVPKVRSPLPAELPVKAALEWAFGIECARFDYDEIGASSGGLRQGRSTEALLAERHALEVIASVVRASLPWHAACTVADLARAGRTPDWMRDARPQLVPIAWVWGRGGKRGRTGDSAELGTVDDADPLEPVGWPHQRRRNRKGAIVEDVVIFTPCTWTPTAAQIGAARRAYLDWYGWLLEVQWALRNTTLRRFSVNERMPALRPWAGER